MPSKWRARLVQIGLALIGLLLLVFTLRTVSLSAIWTAFSQLSATDLLVLAIANLLVLCSFTGRWWFFLYGLGFTVSYVRLFGYRLAAFGVSYFTPGPHFGGEPLQVYLPTERQNVPVDASIASVTLDKLFELLANFTFLLVGLIFLTQGGLPTFDPLNSSLGNQALLYAVLLLAAPGALLAAIWRGYHPLSGLLMLPYRRWPSPTLLRWSTTMRRSEDQAAWLCRERPRILIAAMLVSGLSWVLLVGEYWLMTRLLGLELTFGQAILALIAARIAILLPMPAGLGALEASQAIALSLLGMDAAAGVALAFLIRARDVLLGLLGLWIGGVSIWEIAAEHAEEGKDGEPISTDSYVPGTSHKL